ncbi:MAG: nuclear transport factor 2 family protein [Solirubrobacteraceae bacterium]
MSRENVEIVRRALAAWDSGELERILELTHPDFVAEVPPEVSAEPDSYRGHSGIRRYVASFEAAMEDIRFEGERLWDAGESVVVELLLTARGRQTAIVVEQRTAGVWTVRDGRIYRIRAFATLEDALATVDLAE